MTKRQSVNATIFLLYHYPPSLASYVYKALSDVGGKVKKGERCSVSGERKEEKETTDHIASPKWGSKPPAKVYSERNIV